MPPVPLMIADSEPEVVDNINNQNVWFANTNTMLFSLHYGNTQSQVYVTEQTVHFCSKTKQKTVLVYQKWFTGTLHCTQQLFFQEKTHLELFLKSSGVSEQMLLTELLDGSSEVTGIDLSHSTHQLLQDGIMDEDVLSLV